MHGTSRTVRTWSLTIAGFAIGSLLLGASVAPALAQSAPTSLPVSGTLMALPNEPGAARDTGGLVLASTAGPILPLDATAVDAATDGTAKPGDRIDGIVELPNSVARTVAEAGSQLSARRTLSLVSEFAASADVELPLSEATVQRRTAAAAPSPQHTADVAFISKRIGQPAGSVPSENDLRALMRSASDYWTGQLSGKVTGVAVEQLRQMVAPVGGDVCDAEATWVWAAAQFGKTVNDYGLGGSPDHLVVVVSDAGAECGVGLGSVGPKLSGGVVWVNLAEEPASEGTHTLAHELGHNFDLDHANARVCDGTAVDALYGPGGTVRAPCVDEEYGDLWSAMGTGVSGFGVRPALISLNQLSYLGGVPAGALANVPASGGSGKVYTLNALSSGSGLRGLRVQPVGADPFFVEYRNGLGQDEGFPRPIALMFNGAPISADRGVKVVKTPPSPSGYGVASAVLSPWRSNNLYNETLAAGQALKPLGGATVTVLSTTDQQARVRIDFPTPKRLTATPTPKISGTAKVGKRLTVKAGSWKPGTVKLRYQWKRNGKAISGATKTAYKLVKADRKKRITVTVTGSKSGYITVSKTSKASKRVR